MRVAILVAGATLVAASPGDGLRHLVTRQGDMTSMLPEPCRAGCTTFATIYAACRADKNGEPCMEVCAADKWKEYTSCLTCVEANGGGSFGSAVSGVAERCLTNKGVDPRVNSTANATATGNSTNSTGHAGHASASASTTTISYGAAAVASVSKSGAAATTSSAAATSAPASAGFANSVSVGGLVVAAVAGIALSL